MPTSSVTLFPAKQRAFHEPKSPEQLGFWPLKAQRIYPPNDSKGTSYSGEVVAENGVRYFVKTSEGNAFIPFSEVFSYELCRSLSVTTPAWDRIEMPDHSIAFGSRHEAASEDGQVLVDLIATDPAVSYACGLQFSRLIVIDAFLSNIDRSFKNVLWLPNGIHASRPPLDTKGPPGAIIALDFDKAFLPRGWPLPAVGFSYGTASHSFYDLLRRKNLVEARTIGQALSRLANLPNGFIEVVLSKCSSSWLEATIRQEFISWWMSPLRGVRVSETERYLKNDLKISVFHS